MLYKRSYGSCRPVKESDLSGSKTGIIELRKPYSGPIGKGRIISGKMFPEAELKETRNLGEESHEVFPTEESYQNTMKIIKVMNLNSPKIKNVL